MQPNLVSHPARRVLAWGVVAPAIIAVASALFMVVAESDDTVAINPPWPDRPLHSAENASTDDAGGASCALIDRIRVAMLAQRPLTLHL